MTTSCGPGVESVGYRSYRIGSYTFRSDENYLHSIGIGDSDLRSVKDTLLASSSAIDNNNSLTTGESGQSQLVLNEERLFEYDGAGNRAKTVENSEEQIYEIGPGNRVTRAGDIRFAYDDNGNMISRTKTGETWAYIYDARNCMTVVQKNGVTVARYAYDPEGNRFKALYPRGDGANDGIYYHYDYTGMLTENPIVEEPVSGPKRNFIFLGRKLLAREDGDIGSGEKYWYMTDHLGSAHGLMDQSGQMVWWADYEAFGKVKGVGGPDSGVVDEAPRFTGKAWDETVGLYYFNARWYDPGIARFIGEDPWRGTASLPLTLNKYRYALNNPNSYIDPTGMYEKYKDVYVEGIKTLFGQNEIKIGEYGEVTDGDSLRRIAEEIYGDESFWPIIAAANNISNPDHIEIGQMLFIPDIRALHAGEGLEWVLFTCPNAGVLSEADKEQLLRRNITIGADKVTMGMSIYKDGRHFADAAITSESARNSVYNGGGFGDATGMWCLLLKLYGISSDIKEVVTSPWKWLFTQSGHKYADLGGNLFAPQKFYGGFLKSGIPGFMGSSLASGVLNGMDTYATTGDAGYAIFSGVLEVFNGFVSGGAGLIVTGIVVSGGLVPGAAILAGVAVSVIVDKLILNPIESLFM